MGCECSSQGQMQWGGLVCWQCIPWGMYTCGDVWRCGWTWVMGGVALKQGPMVRVSVRAVSGGPAVCQVCGASRACMYVLCMHVLSRNACSASLLARTGAWGCSSLTTSRCWIQPSSLTPAFSCHFSSRVSQAFTCAPAMVRALSVPRDLQSRQVLGQSALSCSSHGTGSRVG